MQVEPGRRARADSTPRIRSDSKMSESASLSGSVSQWMEMRQPIAIATPIPIPMPSGGHLRQVSERSGKPGYPETLAQPSIDDLDADLVVDVDLDLDSKIL